MSDTSPTRTFRVSTDIAFDHLDRQVVNGGARDCDAAAALGVDAGAGEHADLERGVVGQRYPDMAELVGAIDLRRNQPDAADEVGARHRG